VGQQGDLLVSVYDVLAFLSDFDGHGVGTRV